MSDPRAAGGCPEAAWPAWAPLSPSRWSTPCPACILPIKPQNCIFCWGWCVWFSLPASRRMAKAGGSSLLSGEPQTFPSPFCLCLAGKPFGTLLCCPKWLHKLHKGCTKEKSTHHSAHHPLGSSCLCLGTRIFPPARSQHAPAFKCLTDGAGAEQSQVGSSELGIQIQNREGNAAIPQVCMPGRGHDASLLLFSP